MASTLPTKLLSLKNRPPLKELISRFKSAFPKGELYLVGGSVRDALMGRDGGKDLDLVVRLVPANALEKFLAKNGKVNLVGKRFGVWKFVPGFEAGPQQAQTLDIALPRTEHSFNSGGYRDVSVDSDPELPIEKDLARRDFTVNAMALRLAPTAALIDPFDGQKDLRSKLIRCVGEPAERFREDYSRMLRGLRFACQLGFTLEDHVMGAIRALLPRINDYQHTPLGNMRVVSTEIIARELAKALTSDPVRAFDLWNESGATEILMPEMLAMRNCRQPTNFHSEGDVWTHTRLALSKIGDAGFQKMFGAEKPPALVHFSVLFHDIAKPATMQTPEEHGVDRIRYTNHDRLGAEITEAIAKRLTLSSAEGFGIDAEKLAWLVRTHLFVMHGNVDEIRPGTLEKYFFNPVLPGRELLMLMYCDGMATVPEGGIGPEHLRPLARLIERIKELEAMGAGRRLPAPLLNGGEIMKLLKIEPGPKVGEIIAALREEQLTGKIKTKAEAKKFVKTI
jgi:tRNA nucleotidyltransferase/poly(A) polymerase